MNKVITNSFHNKYEDIQKKWLISFFLFFNFIDEYINILI